MATIINISTIGDVQSGSSKILRWCKAHKLISITAGITSALCLRKLMDVVYRKWYNYPPGPVGLPLIGSLLKLQNYPYFASLVNYYGSVFMVNAAFSKFVFLNDLETVQKSFVKKEFMKSDMNIHEEALPNAKGAKMMLRRQLLMKSFVSNINTQYFQQAGSKLLQKHLLDILDEASNNSRVVNLLDLTRYPVFSLIFASSFGKYVNVPEKTNSDYVALMDRMKKFLKNFFYVSTVSVLIGKSDFSSWILENMSTTKEYMEHDKFMNKICEEWFDEFTHNYGEEILDEFDDSSSLSAWYKQYKNGKLTKGEVIYDIRVMFIGGIDTTVRTTAKCLRQMAKYPDIQDKLYKELKDIIGDDENNILKYIPQLHVFRAFIHESMRFKDDPKYKMVIAMTPRIAMDDNLKINGYNIPKNAQIVSFNTLLRLSEKYWNEPEKFDINHFLDEDGKFTKNVAWSLFGYGRRSCPGVSLAMRMLYMLLGKMILNYKFHSNGMDLPEIHWKSTVANLYVTKR